jgi:hypothetical protein
VNVKKTHFLRNLSKVLPEKKNQTVRQSGGKRSENLSILSSATTLASSRTGFKFILYLIEIYLGEEMTESLFRTKTPRNLV